MNFTKNSKGITLVALVVTIIVLLILAAVSLNLVAGGDGILGRATKATEETNKAKITEEIELAMAELKTDYYEARYVNRNTEFTSFATYAADKLEVKNGVGGIETSSGAKITLSGTTIAFTKEGKTEATGSFNDNGNGNVTIGGITIAGEEEKTSATLASQIEPANYGEYVDLGTEILLRTEGVITQKLGGETPTEQPTTDWRIFHKDSDGVYLILADYLPYEYETNPVPGSSTILGTGLLNNGTDYLYNWKSGTNRIDLIDRLNAKESLFPDGNPWNKLISNTYTAKGITVTGGVELETWVDSWNAKVYIELFTAKKTGMSDGLEGYYIGTSENPETINQSVNSGTAGYGNTLYFPHTVSLSNNYGYWLASPSADGTNSMVRVDYSGYLGSNDFNNKNYGVRPAVFIPSDITAEKIDGVWKLDI